MLKMKLALVLCGSLIAGVASAAPLKKIDVDHDGTITAQERATFQTDMKAKRIAMRQERLAKFDTNKDGKLDPAERSAAHKVNTAALFKRLDVDGNGSISLGELENAKLGKMKHGRRGSTHGRGGFKQGRPGTTR